MTFSATVRSSRGSKAAVDLAHAALTHEAADLVGADEVSGLEHRRGWRASVTDGQAEMREWRALFRPRSARTRGESVWRREERRGIRATFVRVAHTVGT